MNRKERIYQYILEISATRTEQDSELGHGPTTKMVADALNIQRPNVSKDLNQLVREGKLYKTEGRPVRYLAVKMTPHQPLSTYVPSYKEETLNKTTPISHKQDVFRTMIGANGSMKNAVEQAKAAVLYPPKD